MDGWISKHLAVGDLFIFTADLWETCTGLCVVIKDAAVGALVLQSGVVVSGRAADATWPFSFKKHVNILHNWRVNGNENRIQAD